MRMVSAFEFDATTATTPGQTLPADAGQLAHEEAGSGDALAAASLFGIVGGLFFAFAIAPVVPAVMLGAVIGAGVGVVIAYH